MISCRSNRTTTHESGIVGDGCGKQIAPSYIPEFAVKGVKYNSNPAAFGGKRQLERLDKGCGIREKGQFAVGKAAGHLLVFVFRAIGFVFVM